MTADHAFSIGGPSTHGRSSFVHRLSSLLSAWFNGALIFTGGALVFVAATLLALHLWSMRSGESSQTRTSIHFYVMGLTYLLLGVIVGAGLWLGWSGPLHIGVPVEVHIHANNWGFVSLALAGLLIG